MNDDTILWVQDLAAARAGAVIVRNFSLKVKRNEVVALLGPNGAGKSTVVDAICGFADKVAGKVYLEGEDITRLPPHEIAYRGLIQVSQYRDLFPGMSVAENLLMGLEALKKRHDESRSVAEVTELFPVLKERWEQRAESLSGGEQQMLAIARALLGRPRVLLLDEPSSGLAPLIVQEIGEFLRNLTKKGLTIVLVEQNVGIALEICSRFVVLRQGRILFDDTRAALGDNPRDFLSEAYI